jgi:hypothetical protein
MDDSAKNLAAGLEAVRFVKGKMRFGARNNVRDIWQSRGESISCVDNLRAEAEATDERLLKDYGKTNRMAGIERELEYTAAMAARMGCGNCNEQAALAFIYLRDKGIFPLDWVNKANFVYKFGGHSFVVIGRENRKVKPAEWGASAVICDPHGLETAFPASQFEKFMPGVQPIGMIRLDEASSSSIRVNF